MSMEWIIKFLRQLNEGYYLCFDLKSWDNWKNEYAHKQLQFSNSVCVILFLSSMLQRKIIGNRNLRLFQLEFYLNN